MAAGSTYTPIATTTIGASTASYTFSSIPSTYTDLVLVTMGGSQVGDILAVQFNGDTGTSYSETLVYGTGSSALSSRTTSNNWISLLGKSVGNSGNNYDNSVMSIMNYANTTTYKTVLSRQNIPAYGVVADVGLWRNTAAINAIKIITSTGNIVSGTTFTLYGIAAA